MGNAADKLGSRRVCVICFLIISATLFWLIQITDVWAFFVFTFIYGLGAGGVSPLESTIVVELFGMKFHGLILGIVSFGFNIGAALGPFLTGYLFDLNGNYTSAVLICAIMAAMGLLLSAILRRSKSQKSEPSLSGRRNLLHE